MIEQILVWLWRIGHCRGFGIQSPWAYSFVRYVINEHYPYYAYETFDTQQSARRMSAAERKKGKLYFRIANFMQADEIIVVGEETIYDDYFRHGCKKTRINHISNIKGCRNVRLLLVATKAATIEMASLLTEATADGGMIILENIHRDRKARQLWRQLKKTATGVVMFDLHYCGIVYVDAKRHRQKYIVNF